MLYTVTTPPTGSIWQLADIKAALRIDISDDDTLLMRKLAAATNYAETAMATALLTRTMVAFYDPPERLWLPMGPVQSIISVADAVSTYDPSLYQLRAHGNCEYVHLLVGIRMPPMVVTYTCGYGTAADVPADIAEAIMAHTGLLYGNRESATGVTLTAVPHQLEAFYKLHSRQPLAG
jgi:uncharacterized phiE125 gp8 family phage protein